jgi:hypothetical protein
MKINTGMYYCETFMPKAPALWLFGAGHVARQLLKLLPGFKLHSTLF